MTDDKRTKQVRQWRSARMERFAQIQLRKREWLNFEEVAVLCSELDGSGVPNKAAHENANRNLEHDLLRDIAVPSVQSTFPNPDEDGNVPLNVGQANIIVLSQSCDLAPIIRESWRLAM